MLSEWKATRVEYGRTVQKKYWSLLTFARESSDIYRIFIYSLAPSTPSYPSHAVLQFPCAVFGCFPRPSSHNTSNQISVYISHAFHLPPPLPPSCSSVLSISCAHHHNTVRSTRCPHHHNTLWSTRCPHHHNTLFSTRCPHHHNTLRSTRCPHHHSTLRSTRCPHHHNTVFNTIFWKKRSKVVDIFVSTYTVSYYSQYLAMAR